MKMQFNRIRKTLLAAFALIALACGCETNRVVHVVAPRTESGGAGISSAESLAWFTNVANQCQVSVGRPQILSPDITEYLAGSGTNHLYFKGTITYSSLSLWLYRKEIAFDVSFFGTAKETPKARELATLFTDKLDQRQIPYKVTELVAVPFLGP
jgi:hypothetical protein